MNAARRDADKRQVNGPWLKEQDRGLTAGVSLWTRCLYVHADVIAARSLLSGHLDTR